MATSAEMFNTLVEEIYSYLSKEQARLQQAKTLVQDAATAEVCAAAAHTTPMITLSVK